MHVTLYYRYMYMYRGPGASGAGLRMPQQVNLDFFLLISAVMALKGRPKGMIPNKHACMEIFAPSVLPLHSGIIDRYRLTTLVNGELTLTDCTQYV